MAQIPTKEDTDAIKANNNAEIQVKVDAQHVINKSFNVDAGGHGAGVVPELVWTTLPGKVEN